MNKNNVIQFTKDGLAGLVAACLMYGIMALAAFFLVSSSSISYVLGQINLYVMPPLCLMMFLSVGINGRSIENIIPRKSWGKPILKMLSVSWAWFRNRQS